jgi:nucleolin
VLTVDDPDTISMAKAKPEKGAAATPLSSVKDARVVKPAKSIKSKAKEIAKAFVSKGKDELKAAVALERGDSEEPSDSDSESDDSGLESSDASDVENEEPNAKANGAISLKADSKNKLAESDVSSDGSSDSDEESEVGDPRNENINAGKRATFEPDSDASDDEEEDDDNSSLESDDDENEEEIDKEASKAAPIKVNGASKESDAVSLVSAFLR